MINGISPCPGHMRSPMHRPATCDRIIGWMPVQITGHIPGPDVGPVYWGAIGCWLP
ncbi:MAG: hypothetical protein AB4352_11080 [Hormoscilla sp.]